MNQRDNAAQFYLEKQIMNASPAERVVLLYNGAIKFLTLARQAIDKGDIQERFNNNKRAGDIIAYLMETLDMEKGGEIAFNLQKLYFYMLNRLIEVDTANSVEAAEDVLEKLRMLQASWVKLANGDLPDAQPTAKGENATEGSPTPARRSAIA